MSRRNLTASSITLAALIAVPLVLGASACELIASVDRSLIDQGENGGSTAGGESSASGGESAAAAGGKSPGSGGESPATGGGAGTGDSGAGGDAGASGDTSTGGSPNTAGLGGGSGHGGSFDGAGSSGLGGSSGHAGSSNVAGSSGVAGNSNVAGSAGMGGSSNAAGSSGVGGSSNAGGSGVGGSSGMGGSSNAGGSGAGGSSGVGGNSNAAGDDAGGSSSLGGAGGGSGALPGRVIYVTSTPKKATFGGVSGADAQCNLSPPIAGTYKALLVDGTTRVACTSAQCVTAGAAEGIGWVLAPNTKYVRADGTTLIGTTTSAAIFSFPLAASLGTSAIAYWTGLSSNWTTSADTCSGWSQFTSDLGASQGLADATDQQALSGVSDNCATLAGAFFACVQQ